MFRDRINVDLEIGELGTFAKTILTIKNKKENIIAIQVIIS